MIKENIHNLPSTTTSSITTIKKRPGRPRLSSYNTTNKVAVVVKENLLSSPSDTEEDDEDDYYPSNRYHSKKRKRFTYSKKMNFNNNNSATGTSPAPFILKLRHLTTIVPYHIARWNEEGTLFIVLDMDGFAKIVHEVFSRPTSSVKLAFQTLTRQLHYYSFSKVETYAPQRGWGFRHKYFLRDDVSKQNLIKRCVKVSNRETGDEEEEQQQSQHQQQSLELVHISTPSTGTVTTNANYVSMLERKVTELEATVSELRTKLANMELQQRQHHQQQPPPLRSVSITATSPQPMIQQSQPSSTAASNTEMDWISGSSLLSEPLGDLLTNTDEVMDGTTLSSTDYSLTPDFDLSLESFDDNVTPFELSRQHSLLPGVVHNNQQQQQFQSLDAVSTLMYYAANAAIQQQQTSAAVASHHMAMPFSFSGQSSQHVGAF
jgi:hypothetical protein